MFGSCCEEQEAKEAEARSRIRAATEINESRMMRGHRVREELKRALHCGDPCCAHLDCQVCEEDDEPAPVVATETQASESEDDDFFDDEDEALMAKMRAARMGQMQAAVQDAVRRRADLGTHARLREGESLTALLAADDPAPVVLHLALGESAADDDQCVWVEEVLKRAAPGFSTARLVTEVRESSKPPEWLHVPALPALAVVEGGIVTSVFSGRLDEMREPQVVSDRVARWLEGERARLEGIAHAAARRKGTGGGGDDDEGEEGDEDAPQSYCGRPGCKAYAHEHVGDNRMPGNRFEGDPFAR